MLAREGKQVQLTEGWPAILTEESRNVVGDTLGASEDEDLVGLILHDALEMPCHLVALVEVSAYLNDLSDAVVSGAPGNQC